MNTVLPLPAAFDLVETLGPIRLGLDDPSFELARGGFTRCTMTPEGPATLRGTRRDHSIVVEHWGDGGHWAMSRALDLLGGSDHPERLDPSSDPRVDVLVDAHPGFRLCRTGDLFGALLAAVATQGVSHFHGHRAHRQLLLTLGEPAPGPASELRTPPTSDAIAGRGAYELHKIGFDPEQAHALLRAAAFAHGFDGIDGPLAARRALEPIDALAPGTVERAVLTAFGDPDALLVDEVGIARLVGRFLAGESHADADRARELLEPWRGQRARLVRLIQLEGDGALGAGPEDLSPSSQPRSA